MQLLPDGEKRLPRCVPQAEGGETQNHGQGQRDNRHKGNDPHKLAEVLLVGS